MSQNHNGVIRTTQALAARAFDVYATARRLHDEAHANWMYVRRRHGEDHPLTLAALESAAVMATYMADAKHQHTAARNAALVTA